MKPETIKNTVILVANDFYPLYLFWIYNWTNNGKRPIKENKNQRK